MTDVAAEWPSDADLISFPVFAALAYLHSIYTDVSVKHTLTVQAFALAIFIPWKSLISAQIIFSSERPFLVILHKRQFLGPFSLAFYPGFIFASSLHYCLTFPILMFVDWFTICLPHWNIIGPMRSLFADFSIPGIMPGIIVVSVLLSFLVAKLCLVFL